METSLLNIKDQLRRKIFSSKYYRFLIIFICALVIALSITTMAKAVNPPQNPQNGSVGLEGTVSGPPPSQAATITTPANGQTFTTQPITIAGLCPSGLLIKLFSNNTFIGSTNCTNGSFSLQATLFYNQNVLMADDYDNLGQAGPESTTVTVNFNNPQLAALGTSLTITSIYAKQGSNPGQQLSWPIIINGGTAPYALSIDWGDGSQPQLQSEANSGDVTLTHTYQNAGTYTITIQATDKNGETAYLQVVGLANGTSTKSSSTTTPLKTVTKTIWWPAVALLPLLAVSFWLGQREELFRLRREAERSNELLE